MWETGASDEGFPISPSAVFGGNFDVGFSTNKLCAGCAKFSIGKCLLDGRLLLVIIARMDASGPSLKIFIFAPYVFTNSR